MTNDTIQPLPPIPDGLREAAARRVLIPFIGAGASRLAGCPSWPEFADMSLSAIAEQRGISYGQLAQINHLTPRIKLSIARNIIKEQSLEIDLVKIISPKDGYQNPSGRRLYSSLSKLGRVFVTTNYDEWLDSLPVTPEPRLGAAADPSTAEEQKKREIIHRVTDFSAASLDLEDAVIHLHGSVHDPAGMIMTTRDYIDHYAINKAEENRVTVFLQHLFKEKVVLFIGYGLEELEILEYVVFKARQQADAREVKHYMLQGFFSHEQELMLSLKKYFQEECNVQLIPFLKDEKGWNQLQDVLEEFVRHIPAGQPLILERKREMEGLLDE